MASQPVRPKRVAAAGAEFVVLPVSDRGDGGPVRTFCRSPAGDPGVAPVAVAKQRSQEKEHNRRHLVARSRWRSGKRDAQPPCDHGTGPRHARVAGTIRPGPYRACRVVQLAVSTGRRGARRSSGLGAPAFASLVGGAGFSALDETLELPDRRLADPASPSLSGSNSTGVPPDARKDGRTGPWGPPAVSRRRETSVRPRHPDPRRRRRSSASRSP
jgi:hypothetical protein